MTNKKAVIFCGDYGSNKLTERKLQANTTPKQNNFQYECSFCLRELPSGGIRFAGIGACPSCNNLAHFWIDSLREHAANYPNNLGVKR